MSLSLQTLDAAKSHWIKQISLLFTLCQGYYVNEQDDELEVQFTFNGNFRIQLFIKNYPNNDIHEIIDVLSGHGFAYIDLLRFSKDKEINILNLCPNIGLECLFFRNIFIKSNIYLCNIYSKDINQVNRNMLLNSVKSINLIDEEIKISSSIQDKFNFLAKLIHQTFSPDTLDVLVISAYHLLNYITTVKNFKSELANIMYLIVHNIDDSVDSKCLTAELKKNNYTLYLDYKNTVIFCLLSDDIDSV